MSTLARRIAGPCFAVASLLLSARFLGAQGSLTGVWASEGYGRVFEFRGDSLLTFQVTSLSCLLQNTIPARSAQISVESANRLRLHYNQFASDRILMRLDRLPRLCDSPPLNTPIANFDIFVATWSEHYPFFAEHGVNWPAVVSVNRPRVSDATTRNELFAILSGMIGPLNDAHSFISGDSGQWQQTFKRSPSFLKGDARDTARALVLMHLIGPVRQLCNGNLEFGMLAPDIAFLRINGFQDFSGSGSWEADTASLNAAFDTLFVSASAWSGLVLDLRLNGGGIDPYGLLIASRLTTIPYVAYDKQARMGKGWTTPQRRVVQPVQRPAFIGPIVELIGINTYSAAETFTQALFNRPVKVTRVGEPTQGLFSDVLTRRLPNGFQFGLPNERVVTNGRSYDVVGIAPDVAIESFTPAGLASRRDAGVEKAIAILRGGRER